MSWEVINKNSIKCLCGKGEIVQEIKADDWNRVEEAFPIICCNICKDKYIIESKMMSSKHKHEFTIYYCIEKNDKSKKIKLDL